MEHNLKNNIFDFLDHEEEYNEILNKIEKDFKEGKISEVERTHLISKAKADEMEIRRKETENRVAMFGLRDEKPDSDLYYQQCILEYIDNQYIQCNYYFKESVKASRNYDYLIKNINRKNSNLVNSMNKKIYEDLLSGNLDILNTTGEELLKIYGI